MRNYFYTLFFILFCFNSISNAKTRSLEPLLKSISIVDFNKDILSLCKGIDEDYIIKNTDLTNLILSDKYTEPIGTYLFDIMQEEKYDCETKEECMEILANIWNNNQEFQKAFCGTIQNPHKPRNKEILGMYYVGRYIQLNKDGIIWSSDKCEFKEKLYNPVYNTTIDYILPKTYKNKIFTDCSKPLIINISAKQLLATGIISFKKLLDKNKTICADKIIDGKSHYYILMSIKKDNLDNSKKNSQYNHYINFFKPIVNLDESICSVFDKERCPVC